MTTITKTLITNPPPALEVVYNYSLPGYDNRQEISSLGFPIAYYDGINLSPQDNVLFPSISIEGNNRVYTETKSIPFESGYGTSGTVSDILFTHSSVTGNLFVKFDPYQYTNVSTSIQMLNIGEDSSQWWYPTFKNGLVYKDITVTQAELDYSGGATGNGSWLASAGFVAGDRIRVFYTLPQECFLEDYSSQGVVSISNNTLVEQKNNCLGFHTEKGNIFVRDSDLVEFNDLDEISSVGHKLIFSNQVITDIYQGSTYKVLGINLTEGTLNIIPPPNEGSLMSANYKSNYKGFAYKGFRNDKTGVWNNLDLNPSIGHVFNNGLDSEIYPSYELLSKSVVIYLLPSSAIKIASSGDFTYPLKYYSAFNEGGKDYTWSPLRHYVQLNPVGSVSGSLTAKQSTTWGFGVYDVSYYEPESDDSAINKGIPLYQNSALLLSILRVNINSNVELSDARRFSGLAGYIDRQEKAQSTFWDLSSWEGLTAPLAGVVLVEVEEWVLNKYSIQEIEEVVKKQLPPGVQAIIRKKE